jgi:hypothetical protein
MSEYKPNLKIEVGEPKLVKFLFNDAIPVTTKFGQRYRYTLSTAGVEHQMLATSTLHGLISQHSPLRDKELTIGKVKVDDKITTFTINGMTMDDLKKKEGKDFTSVLDGSKSVGSYDDGVVLKGSLDDLWREINKLNKALKVVMERAEALESSKTTEADEDLPF